jgi:hypothetical protein
MTRRCLHPPGSLIYCCTERNVSKEVNKDNDFDDTAKVGWEEKADKDIQHESRRKRKCMRR